MGYLVGKYAKNKSLYPDDVEQRALIDQRLYFDSGVLFARHLRVAVRYTSCSLTRIRIYLLHSIYTQYKRKYF